MNGWVPRYVARVPQQIAVTRSAPPRPADRRKHDIPVSHRHVGNRWVRLSAG